MRNRFCVLTLIGILLLVGCAPGVDNPAGGAPQAWIDAPLGGSTLPLAQVEVVSHASQPGGIAQAELSINGAPLVTAAAPDGSGSLVTFRQQWLPPGPGTYQIAVRAQSVDGVWSAPANVTVLVGDQPTDVGEEPGTDEPTAVSPTPPGGQATATPTPAAAAAGPRLKYSYNPEVLDPGGCFTLTWEGISVQSVALNGSPLDLVGSREICPRGTTAYILSATSASGPITHQFTVVVNQAQTAPTTAPSGAVPSLGSPAVNGSQIYNVSGCGDPTALIFNITVYNADQVRFHYRVSGGDWRTLNMTLPGSAWTVTLHSDSDLTSHDGGALEYYFTARSPGQKVDSQVYGGITVLNCKP